MAAPCARFRADGDGGILCGLTHLQWGESQLSSSGSGHLLADERAAVWVTTAPLIIKNHARLPRTIVRAYNFGRPTR